MFYNVSNLYIFPKTVVLFIYELIIFFDPVAVNITSSAFVKSEQSFAEEQNSVLDEPIRESVPKLGGRLMQSVSNIVHSPFSAPRRPSLNCSAYMPTPFQMWTMCDGRIFHYSNWPEQAVPTYPVEPQTSPGFSVSDNSAFVKYCNQPSRMENNSFRFGPSSSEEAAAVLASFGNSEHGIRNR